MSELVELLGRRKGVLRAELTFVVELMGPLYDTIKVLQKDNGGIVDVLGEIHRCDLGCDAEVHLLVSIPIRIIVEPTNNGYLLDCSSQLDPLPHSPCNHMGLTPSYRPQAQVTVGAMCCWRPSRRNETAAASNGSGCGL